MSISTINDTTPAQVYVFPTSFTQEGLWFLDQLNPGSAAYNLPVALHLRGQLDVELLQCSLNTIVQRHESLRTTFRLMEGQPVQVVAPSLTILLSEVNLQNLPEVEQKVETLRLATEEARHPFDLTQGPLIRATVVHLGAEEHALLLTMHHIISDGWSIGVFFWELTTLYEAFSAGLPSPLPELSIQYPDFVLWQRDVLRGDVLAKHLAYWKQQLAGMPERLDLPTDHPRLPIPTSRGAEYRLRLSRSLTDGLKELSQRQGVTLYMTMVAAFQTLLFRYSGQDDVVIGTVTAGRTQEENEALIGFFANTLVLRTDLSGNPSFKELLTRVRKVVLEAQAHQDLPFEFLVKELQPERLLGQNPLFQVMLTLTPSLSSSPLRWVPTQLVVETGTSKFDLNLELVDQPNGLLARFEYSTDLFDEATIVRMTDHWQMMLEGIVAAPNQHLSELPLLTEVERRQLLIDWNSTQSPYPKDQCVHQLFEAQAERTPDAIALVFEHRQMTYRELNARANQLAHHLQRLGVGLEALVGLCMDRSLDMVISLLGILKAGGAYLPLDPTYPKERLAFMLQETQAPVLVTQSRFIDLFSMQGTHIVCLDTEKTSTQECSENLVSGATAETLAYVMYTSGSTGRPKGVEVKHQSIIRLLFGVDYVRLDATQTLLHMASISFDAATFEIWGALLHGARCILFPERIPTPTSIGAIIRKHNITTAWLTASLFNAVIDEAPDALVGLKQLLTGGEALSVAHIRRALDVLPTTQLINGYGPTESTTFTCCYPIPRQLSEPLRSIPIGIPIGNTQVYVLDRHLNPVPIGVSGELHIGGAGLARGYLNRPELTAEKFITNPFNADPSARLYKTGDLVRYLPDGNIEFLGRFDDQVKIRGFRVELGEIEVVMKHCTTVREALVLTHEEERNGKRIVAYVVPHQGQSVMLNELRSFLKERLPEYMVPSDFILLDSLPLTPNGKIDRHALPGPDSIRSLVKETYVAPTSMVHHQLMQIWEELLDVRPIGIRDNFFSLGGHSLLAARLVDRIERLLSKKVTFATLFAGPTIEDLAKALQGEAEQSSRTSVIGIQANGSKRPFFYLHGTWNSQAFYCFSLARHLGPDQPFYVLEPYQFDDLQAAPTIETMAKAHIESMRTVQPEGPYLLGGFCNGGLIAYEMARQLQAQGERVDLLVLVDPAYPPVSHKLTLSALSRIGNLLGLSLAKQLEWFIRLRHVYKYVRHERNLEDFKEFRAIDPSIHTLLPTTAALRQDNIGISNWIIAAYNYGPYPGKVTLFRTYEEALGDVWQRKAAKEKDIEVQIIPGNHISCRTDHVQDFAEQLRVCLKKVQATELRE